MRLLDLFAGIGGFSLAAHWMGWETAAFVEKEPFCHKVLRKNFGQDIEIHDDIFNFSGEPFRGRADLVTGGFPCQPFSAAGKRKGRHDERHLFPEMLRVIREVRPRWVVAENVRGLLSIESGRVFAEVIASLESEGFEVVTFCVPASAVEAPHRRDRLWIVANSKHEGRDNRRNLRSNRDNNANRRTSSTEGDGHLGRVCTHSRPSDSGSSNTKTARLEGADSAGPTCTGRRHPEHLPRNRWDEPWLEVATRVCGMDARVSDRVHRLKALGNSIVPQVAFEIFKAIEESE